MTGPKHIDAAESASSGLAKLIQPMLATVFAALTEAAYERGLADARAIAVKEEAKWQKEAAGHARKYWGRMNSTYAQSDLKRARIARRIIGKIDDLLRARKRAHR